MRPPPVVASPPPVVASPPEPAPAWIPPAREGHKHKKKKAALTPKEALRAKVQSRAVKQAPKGAPSPEAEVVEAAGASPADPEPGASSRPETHAAAPVRRAAKPRRVPAPPPPVEEEEPAAPPAKPGFFQRILGVFRKAKLE